MKVYVVVICNQFGQVGETKTFSSESKANEWLYDYVKDEWANHYDASDPCPDDKGAAINEFFNGGIVEGHNLSLSECVIDE